MSGADVTCWSGESRSEAETEGWGRELGDCLAPGVGVLLHGDLGCGKSVFARGVLRGLGVEEDYITSPTFTLVNGYDEGRLPVAHFDLYRLSDPEELEGIGVEEYVDGRGVALVEWPERGSGVDFGAVLEVLLEDRPDDPAFRRVTLRASDRLSRGCLDGFIAKRRVGRG
ncbi:MAG: tRNA (adenosine(37)-N6)-threonylcarbamoyltransferase complex ATPase subunit type 1 TsaE [Magnetococcales bacterium]|nr:tRNA (adenosine(37)-N6)-threonylcarbamoyltransferase complex ATPase subunit type 1 TsaE [Magnetococcales bacterium]